MRRRRDRLGGGRLRRRAVAGGSGQIVEHRLVGRTQPPGQERPAAPAHTFEIHKRQSGGASGACRR